MKNELLTHIGQDNFIINGDEESRYFGNLSVSFKNITGE